MFSASGYTAGKDEGAFGPQKEFGSLPDNFPGGFLRQCRFESRRVRDRNMFTQFALLVLWSRFGAGVSSGIDDRIRRENDEQGEANLKSG